jgi:2-dehydropantoate 2-reductase
MEKIAIIGAGAVGCGLGFLLNRAGREVTLIGRADQVEVLRTNGLRVEGYTGEHQVKISAAERLDFKPDLALLAVKTWPI